MMNMEFLMKLIHEGLNNVFKFLLIDAIEIMIK